uniref:Uncharacterized protein n=1 Tax=Spironucleus salmonicida TaxID=348837 RepID=V6LXX0_9EUKA|eukprot:EST49098.1 Hypothetical protein SS50377_10632 [Spironucleus salmonicida]
MQSVKNYFRYQHLYQRGGVTCLHGQRQEARQVCIECVDRYIKLDIIYIKLLNWCKNYLVVLNIYDKCMYGQQTNSFVTSKYKYITCTSTENAEYVQRQLLVVQKNIQSNANVVQYLMTLLMQVVEMVVHRYQSLFFVIQNDQSTRMVKSKQKFLLHLANLHHGW